VGDKGCNEFSGGESTRGLAIRRGDGKWKKKERKGEKRIETTPNYIEKWVTGTCGRYTSQIKGDGAIPLEKRVNYQKGRREGGLGR